LGFNVSGAEDDQCSSRYKLLDVEQQLLDPSTQSNACVKKSFHKVNAWGTTEVVAASFTTQQILGFCLISLHEVWR
jgi:hypothetical protein